MVTLPNNLWLVIVDLVLADESDHGRWRDLAHLAWTCRDACWAAHRPLWRHLRLVIRIEGERESLPALQLECHTQVVASSLFPHFTSGQLARQSERLNRIRGVSKDYPHLQPFVVLEGKLYLASLVAHEEDPHQPNWSGIATLWGSESAGAVRVVGGLVLVPYPLHLVQELTVDALSSRDDFTWSRHQPFCDAVLPFLLTINPTQVHTLRFLSESGQGTSEVYNSFLGHFSSVISYDFFLGGGTHYCPRFQPSAQHICMYHSECFDNDNDTYSELAEFPSLTTFEHYGSGDFCTDGNGMQLFTSKTLTRLVLDFDLDSWRDGLIPGNLHLPSLTDLCLTMQVAQLLFSNATSLRANPSTSLEPIAFATLTHLTLVNAEHVYGTNRKPAPFVPFKHMPNLTHFHIPLRHRGYYSNHIMEASAIQDLAAHTRISSVVIPGLDLIDSPSGTNTLAAAIVAPHLTHLYSRSHVAAVLARLVSLANLTSLKLHDLDGQEPDPSFFAQTPKLTELDLETVGMEPTWWFILAQHVPGLQRLTIFDHGYTEDVGKTFGISLDAPNDPVPTLANLKSLSFTMLRGSYTFRNLGLPRLKHLDLRMEHPRHMESVYEQLDSLKLVGPQCGANVFNMLEWISKPSCRVVLVPGDPIPEQVKFCHLESLEMRFSGNGNRHVWQALLEGNALERHGMVKEAVAVVLERDQGANFRKAEDATLIANVLAHLLSKQDEASIECQVGFDGMEGSELSQDQVDVGTAIVSAVEAKGIQCLTRVVLH